LPPPEQLQQVTEHFVAGFSARWIAGTQSRDHGDTYVQDEGIDHDKHGEGSHRRHSRGMKSPIQYEQALAAGEAA
jgi:hypothetical protein